LFARVPKFGYAQRPIENEWQRMRTLTGYGIVVIVVLAALNGTVWLAGNPPRFQSLWVFSAGFILGMLAMYIAANLYGYHQ